MLRRLLVPAALAALLLSPVAAPPAGASPAGQEDTAAAPSPEPSSELASRVAALETRVERLARELDERPVGLILVLFGGFCALWAQNTGRSAWLWFFLGLFFNVFALVAVLVKNGREASARRGE